MSRIVILIVVGSVGVIYVAATEVLDWAGRFEYMQSHYPRLVKWSERRGWRVAALFVASGLLATAVYEQVKRPEETAPSVRNTEAHSLPASGGQESGQPASPSKTVVTKGRHTPRPIKKIDSAAPTNGQSVSAPNGIAIGGGNVSNPTVNNYGAVDRHLSPAAANALNEIAQSIPNKTLTGPVGFIVVQNAEAETFADEIAMVFYKSGVGVGRAVGGMYWSPQTPKGVIVSVKARDDPAFPFAERIASAMNNNGVPAVGIMLMETMTSGRVHIIVGDRTDGPPVSGTTSTLVVR